MAIPSKSFDVPYRTEISEGNGFLTRAWEWFFRSLWERVFPLGVEKSFALKNNQSTATDITGLKFNKRGVSSAIVEYLIQRVTTGTGATEKVEAGIFIVCYRPSSKDWKLNSVLSDKPDDSGITFSITAAGQVQYTSTSITGTDLISRIVWRERSLLGKHPEYSSVGAR